MNNSITNHIKEFLHYKANVENLAVKSFDAYEHDLLNSFLPFLNSKKILDITKVTQLDIEEYLTQVKISSKTGSVANRNRKLASIQSLYVFLHKRAITQNVVMDIKPLKTHAKIISYLTEDEKQHLIQTVENLATPFYKTRDIAIFKLFLCTGIRVSELTNLKIPDLELHSKGISYIHVRRKGGNEVQLPINNKTAYAIRIYLSKQKRTNLTAPVFVSKNNNPLEANSVYHLVKHYLKKAGITKKKWGPHILRHTVGVSLRRQGVDIATIQNLLGHKKLETTAIYLNVEPQDLERAVQLL